MCLVLWGCFDVEKVSTDPSLGLRFDADSVKFDTLISGRPSVTRRLRVHNPNGKNLAISSIALETPSPYTIRVFGRQEALFEDIFLARGDSLLVLVDLLIKDEGSEQPREFSQPLTFSWNTNEKDIVLQGWGLDVVAIEQDEICDTSWAKGRPLLFSRKVRLRRGCTLRVGAGATLLFDNGAGLLLDGNLQVDGTAEQPVKMRFSNLVDIFDHVPGQWEGIVVGETSSRIEMTGVVMEHSKTGIRVEMRTAVLMLTLTNSVLSHSSEKSLDLRNTSFVGENLILHDASDGLVFHAPPGSFSCVHCTIVNFPSSIPNSSPALTFEDEGEQEPYDSFPIDVRNSFVLGNARENILVTLPESRFTAQLSSCVVRSAKYLDGNISVSGPAEGYFSDPEEYDYSLSVDSPAIDQGSDEAVAHDLLGALRDSFPDIGAIEYVDP